MISIKELKAQLKKKTDLEPDKYYPTNVLKEKGFARRTCRKCGNRFWSVGESDVCGEPDCIGGYTFIGKPVGKKTDFLEVWDSFSKHLRKRGYTPIKRYPVAARWRDDTDFVQASIYDFQPHVVSGAVKPPANPLVVPQYCLRFNSVENTGITGRHNTGFVMIGQHAFTSPDKFDQQKYFRDLFEWFINDLKLPKEELKVIESQWGGGGNLGVSMEFFARGLELANQVYMLYRTTESGYEPLNIKVLDMGMGQDRPAWLTTGTSTIYDTAYPGVCDKLFKGTWVKPNETFDRFIPYGSVMDVDAADPKELESMWKTISKKMDIDEKDLKSAVLPLAALYSVADHCQSLLFALSDGVLPSNMGGGYNLRAILRRSLSFIDEYEWEVSLPQVCEWHAGEWKRQYPELVESLEEVKMILEHEEKKYKETMKKSRTIVASLIKKTKKIDFEHMLRLYESDGITPELVKDVAKKENVEVKVPQDFYAKVSVTHETSKLEAKGEKFNIDGLQPTKKLYYDNISEFTATIVRYWAQGGKHYLVLDQSAFYPESGGQDFDSGEIDGSKIEHVYKAGDAIVHQVEGRFEKGKTVRGRIDMDKRRQLMMHHTATHIINGAARTVLGKHVWQTGSEKTREKARLDITHYEQLTGEQLKKIEDLANKVVKEKRKVIKEVLSRDEAERRYGFRIYQGGAIPSNDIRIVNIKDWDIEACGGTHADNTGEVGPIKIIGSYKKQDGVIRLEYVAGEELIKKHAERQKEAAEKDRGDWIREIADMLKELEKLGQKPAKERLEGLSVEDLIDKWKGLRKEIERVKQKAAGGIEVTGKVQYIPGADMGVLQNIGRKFVEEKPKECVVLVSDGIVFGIRGKSCKSNIEKAVKEAASIMGGSAGGKEEMKGGGPLKDKGGAAAEKAKRLLK